MRIREWTREDVTEVAVITNQVFATDELHIWLFPRKDEYPDDLRRFQLIRLRTRLVTAGQHGFVMVTEESDSEWTGKPEIVGYAVLVRTGEDEVAQKWQQDSLSKKFERYLLSWEQSYHERVLDRAVDLKRAEQYNNMTDYNFYPLLDPRWHLGLLAVSPKYQRRGIGGKLLKYGQKLATEENIPMTLEASVMGRGLYEKAGFRVIDEMAIIEGLNSVAMVWEPEALKGKWIEVSGDGAAQVKGRQR